MAVAKEQDHGAGKAMGMQSEGDRAAGKICGPNPARPDEPRC